MKKIFLIIATLNSFIFANNFLSFKNSVIDNFKKEGDFYLFKANKYLNNKNLSTCILTIKEKRVKSIYCQPIDKINAVGTDEISGELKKDKIIIYTPLIELQDLKINTN